MAKKLLYVLCAVLSIGSVARTTEPELDDSVSHDKKLLALVALAGHFSLCKVSDSYKEGTDLLMKEVKERAILLVVPILQRIERIKEDGLTKHDVIQGIVAIGIPAGLAYHLSLLKGDYEYTAKIIAHDIQFMRDNKYLVGTTIFIVGLGVLSYLEELNMSSLQRFLHSLTHHQRFAIARCEHMSGLVDKVHEDPQALWYHDALQDLLHEHQKDLLKKVVEDHLFDADPMSLLDDFDDF